MTNPRVITERRSAPRLIKSVPLQITLARESSAAAHPAETMNFSKRGAYFAISLKLREGVKLELRLKIPEEIKSLPPLECKFIGRVAHVEQLGKNGMSGVGVHFLYYSLD
ncbi:MAG TPA: PilZ domain-containing protein [Candidatus Acidoferrum sp.]|nr:PilZ domain-containing protein [Candidatus Acidoferrum sp.]